MRHCTLLHPHYSLPLVISNMMLSQENIEQIIQKCRQIVSHFKHSSTTNKNLKKKSALVKHVCLNGHWIDWESSAILAIESDYKKRRFLESFYTHKTDFSFNDKINSLYPELYQFINF